MDWSIIFEDGLRTAFGIIAAVYALTAVGLNLQFGYTGLMNYGQAGFVLVGAYGMAIFIYEVPSLEVGGVDLSLPVGFLIGCACAIVLGLILGIPTLRLRGDYLAIVTISAAEILRITTNSRAAQDVTGGPQGKRFASGFFDVNPFDGRFKLFGAVAFSANTLWVMVWTWGLVAICSVAMFLLMRSPWGRALKAVREDEDAARALGKNVYAYKMQSLVIGGVIGGMAGMMLALSRQFVEPDAFQSSITFLAYAALILGGLARIFGPDPGLDDVVVRHRGVGVVPQRSRRARIPRHRQRHHIRRHRAGPVHARRFADHAARDLPPARHPRRPERGDAR